MVIKTNRNKSIKTNFFCTKNSTSTVASDYNDSIDGDGNK